MITHPEPEVGPDGSVRFNRFQVASMILSSDKEEEIEAKMSQLTDEEYQPNNSWGIALTSCMRGYEGDDIMPEHVEKRNQLQKAECRYISRLFFKKKN